MAQRTLVIGTKRFSSWSLRPWLALKQAGLAFDEVEIALRQPDTKAKILVVSPSGKVPALVEGDLTVWDSLAICDYAAEQVPSLWPSDPAARAVARAVTAEMHAGFQALRQHLPMDMLLSEKKTDIPADAAADIARVQAIWADCRARFGAGGPFLFGRFSIADAFYAPVVSRLTSYQVEVTPVSAAYMAAIWALPAMQAWRAAAK